MNDRVHIIDIDSIVLDGVDHLRPMEVHALVEREVRRALRGTAVSELGGDRVNERRVAGAVADSVEGSIKGRIASNHHFPREGMNQG